MRLGPGDAKPVRESDEIPRQRWSEYIPKRSLPRVFILLAALAGIIYLRGRTSSIAGCMADAFHGPAPLPQATSPVKVLLAQPVLPLDASVR